MKLLFLLDSCVKYRPFLQYLEASPFLKDLDAELVNPREDPVRDPHRLANLDTRSKDYRGAICLVDFLFLGQRSCRDLGGLLERFHLMNLVVGGNLTNFRYFVSFSQGDHCPNFSKAVLRDSRNLDADDNALFSMGPHGLRIYDGRDYYGFFQGFHSGAEDRPLIYEDELNQ